ncbi:element excision factor XisH family protein [Nostoc sp.]
MAKDLYHEQVKRALEKDGWQITHDPYELRIGGVEMYIVCCRLGLNID